MLLDTQSTDNIFCNGDLLDNIRPSGCESLSLVTNGGGTSASMFGDIKGHGQEIFKFFTNTKVVIERWL